MTLEDIFRNAIEHSTPPPNPSALSIPSKKAQEEVRAMEIENNIAEQNKNIRFWLILGLSVISVIWLIFTAWEINSLATAQHKLNDSVIIAFITSSLATVVGLWAIGLNYFFGSKK